MPAEPVTFAAVPLRLAQALSNLLTNAAKYTGPGGTIRLRATSDAEQVTIAIPDTSIGAQQPNPVPQGAGFGHYRSHVGHNALPPYRTFVRGIGKNWRT